MAVISHKRRRAAVRPFRGPVGTGPRILHIMPWALDIGGAQRMLADWLAAHGRRWEAHVAATSADLCWGLCAIVHACPDARAIDALMDELQPALCVHHYPSACWGTSAARCQVWHVHGARVWMGHRPDGQPHAVIVNAPPEDADASWADAPWRIVRLGVDFARYAPAVAVREPREGLVAGIVSRVSAEKIPESFAWALAEWAPGPWKIRIIGGPVTGQWAERLQSILAGVPHVEFAGPVPPSAMPSAYWELDAVLIPSSTETGSYAMAEALACGLPVVARDLAALRWTSGGHCLLAADDAGILAAVRELDGADARAALGALGRGWAVQQLDIERQMEALSAIYAAAAEPAVSILMPVWNAPASFLAEAWESIRGQTWPLWECVIVDDGSSDPETVAEIDRIARDPRVRLIRRPHGGISAALNAGLRECRCDVVARMDADDVMVPERLQRQLDAWPRQPARTAVLGAQMDFLGSHRQPTAHPEEVSPEYAMRNDWLTNHPATLLWRPAVFEAGGYDERLGYAQDTDLWRRLIAAGYLVRNMPDVLVHYRAWAGQMTARRHAEA